MLVVILQVIDERLIIGIEEQTVLEIVPRNLSLDERLLYEEKCGI